MAALARLVQWLGRQISLLWLLLFVALPLVLVIAISFAVPRYGRPPIQPLVQVDEAAYDAAAGEAAAQGASPAGQALAGVEEALSTNFTTEHYERIVDFQTDSLYLDSLWATLKMVGLATVVILVLAYPTAWVIARASPRLRTVFLLLVIVPFWTSLLIRVYAWMVVLQPQTGVLNTLVLGPLGRLFGGDWTVTILNTDAAIQLGLIYTYLPFMVLPIFAALERLDPDLPAAAQDLGASRFTAFWTVSLPLSLPGVAAGCLLVFIPMTGEIVVPSLLGSSSNLLLGFRIWEEYFGLRDWPATAALCLILLAVFAVPMILLSRVDPTGQGGQASRRRVTG